MMPVNQDSAGRAACYAILLALFTSACTADHSTPADDVAACLALESFEPAIRTQVRAAEWVVASPADPWQSPEGFRDRAVVKVPFCRLSATLEPVDGSSIGLELWLPAQADWNGRFFGTASGGSLGAVQYSALTMPLERGYAAMGHDNGHDSKNLYEQNWAFDEQTGKLREEKLVDFGSRAQHVATVVAKAAVSEFYGYPVRHAYYVGCSQGGHHGLMEAQRHPDDYDGIVAGGHGGAWTGMVASQAWAAYHAYRNDRSGALSAELAAAVSLRAIDQCDAGDGLEDRLIEDPRNCAFDPAIMQCGSGTADTEACLTPAQVKATRAIYAGPTTADGTQLAHGFAPDSGYPWWPWTDTFDLVSGSYHDFYRLLVHKDPDWDFLSFDWEHDVDTGRSALGPVYDANEPDLSRFRARGGKLIMYHGWSDPLITPMLSVDQWNAIVSRMGAEATAEFVRLFMIPGMGHCAYGPIGGTRETQDIAWLDAIENWVENDIAPDGETPQGTVVGIGAIGGYLRTRPYCPYPKVARYVGTGSINRAENFVCKQP